MIYSRDLQHLITLKTLITFLTIENNNMNNYIVTFEYRVMVTAFAILAMFVVEDPKVDVEVESAVLWCLWCQRYSEELSLLNFLQGNALP